MITTQTCRYCGFHDGYHSDDCCRPPVRVDQHLSVIHSSETRETWRSEGGGTTQEQTCLHVAHDGSAGDIRYVDLNQLANDYLANGLGYVGRITSIQRNGRWTAYQYGNDRDVLTVTVTVEKEW